MLSTPCAHHPACVFIFAHLCLIELPLPSLCKDTLIFEQFTNGVFIFALFMSDFHLLFKAFRDVEAFEMSQNFYCFFLPASPSPQIYLN